MVQATAFVASQNHPRIRAVAVGGHSDDIVAENDDAYWNAKYALLKQFQEQFGHTYVPRNWGDTQLSDWVKEQQKLVQLSDMSLARREKLAAVGIEIATSSKKQTDYMFPPSFVVDPTTSKKLYSSAWEQRWEDMYEKLVQFKEKHDGFVNCNCKKGYKLDLRLAEWVQIQRENLHLGKMRSDRQSKLEAIGLEPLGLSVP